MDLGYRMMDKFNKSDKKSLKLTHSEICCCTSPLSDRHQCQGTISKRDLNISLGIGATVVFRNAASQLVDEVLFISGCRKRDFTAASEPCLQLARASIVWENANAGSQCFQWKTARIVQACIGLKGGGLPCRITLFTALIHIHRVACPSAAERWTDTSLGQ